MITKSKLVVEKLLFIWCKQLLKQPLLLKGTFIYLTLKKKNKLLQLWSSLVPASFHQQGGTTLLLRMHSQIQLAVTFWAWLSSSGSMSVCVAVAAS